MNDVDFWKQLHAEAVNGLVKLTDRLIAAERVVEAARKFHLATRRIDNMLLRNVTQAMWDSKEAIDLRNALNDYEREKAYLGKQDFVTTHDIETAADPGLHNDVCGCADLNSTEQA